MTGEMNKIGRGSKPFGNARDLNQGVDPEIKRAIERELDRLFKDYPRIVEQLKMLVGERGTNNDQAVTRGTIAALQDIGYMSAQGGVANSVGVPTKAEFDALVDDHNLLYNDVNKILQILDRIARLSSGEKDG